MPMDSVFPVRREAMTVGERHRAEPLRGLEKVWNSQLLSGIREGADYKVIKCLSEPEGREIQRP